MLINMYTFWSTLLVTIYNWLQSPPQHTQFRVTHTFNYTCTPPLPQDVGGVCPLPFFREQEIPYLHTAALGHEGAPASCISMPLPPVCKSICQCKALYRVIWTPLRCTFPRVAPQTGSPSAGCRLLRACSREDASRGLGNGGSAACLVWFHCPTAPPQGGSLITNFHNSFVILFKVISAFLKGLLVISWLLFNPVILSNFIVNFPFSIIGF